MDYTWIKALHVMAVLVWVGGVILNGVALSIFAQEPESLAASALNRLFRWDRSISNPAQGIAWIAGVTLILLGGWFPDVWLVVKLIAVSGVAAIHGTQSAVLRKLATGKEVSTRLALMRYSVWWVFVAIVIAVSMVILKPL